MLKILVLILISSFCLCEDSVNAELDIVNDTLGELLGKIPDLDFSEISSNLSIGEGGKVVSYLKNEKYFVFATLLGDKYNVTINAYLYSADTKETIDAGNGLYLELGFSSSTTGNSDAVLFTYKNNDVTCQDYWGTIEEINKDTDLGGTNDVNLILGGSIKITGSSYKTLIAWTCQKSLTNLDNYDWSDFPNWATNRGNTLAAVGQLTENGSNVSIEYEGKYETLDGGFIKFSFTFLLVLLIFF